MSGEKRKGFIPFPFNGPDAIAGFSHIKLAFQRFVLKADPLKYADKFAASQLPAGLTAEMVADRNCHICGFALVRLTASNGWMLETCSAHQIEQAIKNGSLVKFLGRIGAQQPYNQIDERSKVLNLQNPAN